MSWFNASQLSSFAKQALSQAQKSIDRVLDIQAEETPWPDAVIPDYGDGKGSARPRASPASSAVSPLPWGGLTGPPPKAAPGSIIQSPLWFNNPRSAPSRAGGHRHEAGAGSAQSLAGVTCVLL